MFSMRVFWERTVDCWLEPDAREIRICIHVANAYRIAARIHHAAVRAVSVGVVVGKEAAAAPATVCLSGAGLRFGTAGAWAGGARHAEPPARARAPAPAPPRA